MVTPFSLAGISLGAAKIIDGIVSVSARSKYKYAQCTSCYKGSRRIHSSYIRKIRDLPISTHCVSIDLKVRKFFCSNPDCEKKIFSEQPGPEITAYSRMTNRTIKKLQKILIEVSAQKGSFIAGLISIPVSSSTALRLVNSISMPVADKVTVLGIDDWANRKGLTYGTILVNIETRRVIDLLPGRDGVALKEWLKKHPEVVTVTRDRASAYSSAVSETIPNAIQVADRFHLLTNLSDCIYEVIKNEYSNLAISILEDPSQEETTPISISNKELTKVSQKGKGERNDYDINRFEKVKDLIKNGHTLRSIAKSLQMSRNVVRRYSKMDTLIKKAIYYRNNYSEYQELIEKELSEGKCIKEIFGIVKKAGFNGGMTSFYEYFKDYSDHANSPKKLLSPIKHRIISPRKISRYLKFTDLTNIKDNFDRNNMTALLSKSELLKEIRMQLLSFKELLLGNDDSLLDDWMKKTYSLEKSQLQTFVRGLNIDIEAVRNAIITNWSNGQVEGQVNRLKTIKRQMYGRAGFELLRKKVILSKAG